MRRAHAGGQFVLCDLQGGFYKDGIVLTDPIVMSRNRRYGPTDLGPDGLTAFFNNHICNKFCWREWQKPRVQHTPIVPKQGTSMADCKGGLYVPTHASRPPMTRRVPPVPKFAGIKGRVSTRCKRLEADVPHRCICCLWAWYRTVKTCHRSSVLAPCKSARLACRVLPVSRHYQSDKPLECRRAILMLWRFPIQGMRASI